MVDRAFLSSGTSRIAPRHDAASREVIAFLLSRSSRRPVLSIISDSRSKCPRNLFPQAPEGDHKCWFFNWWTCPSIWRLLRVPCFLSFEALQGKVPANAMFLPTCSRGNVNRKGLYLVFAGAISLLERIEFLDASTSISFRILCVP